MTSLEELAQRRGGKWTPFVQETYSFLVGKNKGILTSSVRHAGGFQNYIGMTCGLYSLIPYEKPARTALGKHERFISSGGMQPWDASCLDPYYNTARNI